MEDFLRSRGCNVALLKAEKIDETCIDLMSDEQLKIYISQYGDRIALRAYLKNRNCKRRQEDRKHSLFERLQCKLKRATSPTRHDIKGPCPQSQNATKQSKMVGIGLMQFDEKKGSYVQVRTKSGGGTRNVTVLKQHSKEDIIKEAKGIFFPDGESKKFGSVSDFEFSLMDYQFVTLDNSMTIQEMSEMTRLSNLRFYLAMKKRNGKDTEHEKPLGETNIDETTNYNTVVARTSVTLRDNNARATEPVFRINWNEPSDSQTTSSGNQSDEDSLPDLNPYVLPDLHTDVDEFITGLEKNISSIKETDAPKHHTMRLHRGHVYLELKQKFKDSRDFALEKDTFTFQMILPNGVQEIAEDNGGVIRDTLVEFWDSFYEHCCLGRDFKVPFLRHDYDVADWQAIASVLYLGWKTEKYFPINISKSFISCCLYGMDIYDTSKDSLVPEYLSYIPTTEADILKSAIDGDMDTDEVIDVLSGHDCRVLPTKGNIKNLIGEIAHKELIQQPMYVKASWFDRLTLLGFSLDDISLDNLYQDLNPNPRKVVKMLNFRENMNGQHIATADFLKRYIREMAKDILARFLRFCTGTNLCLIDDKGSFKQIAVRFTTVRGTGLGRRPVAHTCGRVLELPEQYDSYLEFRSEFNCILKSNIWVMDFV